MQIACKLQTLTLTAGLVGAAATMTSGTAADALAVLSALVKREDIGACTLVPFGYCCLGSPIWTLAGWRGKWRESIIRRLGTIGVATPQNADALSAYVTVLLKELARLQEACLPPENYTLGMRDLMVVRASLESVFLFGVYPALPPGLGLPLSRRSSHYKLVEGIILNSRSAAS